MYEILGACLVLASWLALLAAASLPAELLWRGLATAAGRWSGASRAQFLLLLRLAPLLLSLLCTLTLLIPAYVAHEPRDTAEAVTVSLGLLAGTALYGLGLAAWRAAGRWRATRLLLREWMARAREVRIPGISIPACCAPHPFPVLAIVGVFRPRLFIAEQVLESLDAQEISAAAAHEIGHVVSGDTLKRGLIMLCRDLLGPIPLGRILDRAWLEAAESAADEYAARRGTGAALDLASALVKLSRHIPARPADLAGAFLFAENRGRITTRVLQLTRMTGAPGRPPAARMRLLPRSICAALLLIVAGSFLAGLNPGLLTRVHLALEFLVTVLR